MSGSSQRDNPQRRRSSGAAKSRSRSESRTRSRAAVRPSAGAKEEKTIEQRKATALAAAKAASAVALVMKEADNQRKAAAQQAAEAAQAKTSRKAVAVEAAEAAEEKKMHGAQRKATSTAAARVGNARVRPAPTQDSPLSPTRDGMLKSASARIQHQHRSGEMGGSGSRDHRRQRHSGEHTTGMSNSSGKRHASSRRISSMGRSTPDSYNSVRRSGHQESAVLAPNTKKANGKQTQNHSGNSTSQKEPLQQSRKNSGDSTSPKETLNHQPRRRQHSATLLPPKSPEGDDKQEGLNDSKQEVWNDSFMVVSKQPSKKKAGPLFSIIADEGENTDQHVQVEDVEESPFLVEADPFHAEFEGSDLSDSHGTLSVDESSVHSGSDQDDLQDNCNMDDNDDDDGSIGDFANFGGHQDVGAGEKNYATSEDDEEEEEEDFDFRSLEDNDSGGDDDNKMGDILQFDPSQIGMVQRVKQIASDKKGYQINGQTMQIAEIVDPVSNLQDISISAPLFNLFDDEPLFGDEPAFPRASKQLLSPNKHKANIEGGAGDDDETDSPVSHRRKSLFRLKGRRKSASEDDNDECEDEGTSSRRDFISPATLGYENPTDFKSPATTKEKKSIASKATGYLRNIIHNASHSDFSMDDDKSQVSGRSSRSGKSTKSPRNPITSLFGSNKKKDRGTLLQDEDVSSDGSDKDDGALLYD
jgi:hypothetical protein